MKRLFFLLLLTTVSLSAQTLDQRIDRVMPGLLETYRTLHANPELSTQEAKSSALVAKQLREYGYEVHERVGKYREPDTTSYGVVALLRNGDGPVVLVRSDMDALPVTEQTGLPFASTNPGVMHACGHDLHMTALLGTAKMLADTKAQWRGTVMLIGQPAEEIVRGADAMLRDGLYDRFPRPDFALALHDVPVLEAGKIGYVPGYIMAGSDSINITVRGIGGHGAAPHTTKDPVVLASETVMALQTIVSRERNPLDPVVLTVGMIQGGTKRNIIPDEVKLYATLRTFKPDVRQRILDSIERVAKGVALTAGVPADRMPIVELLQNESVAPTYNDPEFTERLATALRGSLGETNVAQLDPMMVSEDFGRFALDRKIPSSLLFLGAADPAQLAAGTQAGLHSSKWAPLAEPALRTGIKAMTTMVTELLKK
ncbi:MAG TPA: amidohydrolase [Thermoanaerobaculia bacterium]|jgi:hippurate hydrolase